MNSKDSRCRTCATKLCCFCSYNKRNNLATIEEIDKYCSLCMDINCTGCEYHDVHFRNVKKN